MSTSLEKLRECEATHGPHSEKLLGTLKTFIINFVLNGDDGRSDDDDLVDADADADADADVGTKRSRKTSTKVRRPSS